MKAGKVIVIVLFLFVNSLVAADPPQVGNPAPTFFLRTLQGETFFLSKQIGDQVPPDSRHPMVLSFFATWCVPCKAEIPKLHQLQEEFPGVRFYLVNVEEKPELVRKYVTVNKIKLPILMDVYSVVAKKYGVVNDESVAVLPHVVVIGTDGKLLYTHEGYQAGDEVALKDSLQNIKN